MSKVFGFIFLTVFFMLNTTVVWADTYLTKSPDNHLQFELSYELGQLTYQLYDRGTLVIDRTPISITIDGEEYPGGANVKATKRQTIDNDIRPTIPTVRSIIKEHANETLVTFTNKSAVRVRVFNDGAAFRWETSFSDKQVVVNAETLGFNFANDYQLYWPSPNGEGFFSHQESQFEYKLASKVLSNVSQASGPLLVDRGNGRFILVSDVNVEQYPGLWFKGTQSKQIYAVFPHYPKQTKLIRDRDLTVTEYESFLAKTTGKRQYPWRAFVVTDAKGLLNSNLLYTLADPSRIENTDWIKPGKVAWDWFNHWNITDVDFKAGINQETYKNYIDFASSNGLEYVILDEGWSVPEPQTC
jgi:alpha-glucosidase